MTNDEQAVDAERAEGATLLTESLCLLAAHPVNSILGV